MRAQCGYCGEEILGAVNRCWRCGHRFSSSASGDGQPPVRRTPITTPLDGSPPSIEALVVDDGVDRGVEIVPATNTERSPASEAARGPAVSVATPVRPPSVSDSPAGELKRLDSPQASRFGTPFRSDFEPSSRDRWRRRQRQVHDWLRLLVGEPPSRVSARTPTSGSGAPPPGNETRRGGASSSMPAETTTRVAAQADSPPRTPLANASALLGLTLCLTSLVLLPYPLIALLMGGMALALSAISLWAAPRARTVALLALIVASLTVMGWKTAGYYPARNGGFLSEEPDFE